MEQYQQDDANIQHFELVIIYNTTANQPTKYFKQTTMSLAELTQQNISQRHTELKLDNG